MLSTASGFQSMLKEGSKHYQGLEEAIIRNITACKDISNMTKTSLGPNGMKKMVITHLEKVIVTSDSATILKELEVQHPAAKMVIMAGKMQEIECGDGTNLVVALAGELLSQAEQLIKMGLHPSQIISGFQAAQAKALDLLEGMKSWEITDLTNEEQVRKAIRTALASKLSDYTDLVTELVAKACITCLPRKAEDFDIELVRVAKIMGGTIHDSFVLNGLVVLRAPEGTINNLLTPRVAVYNAPLDPQNQDTKGTVLIKNASELLNYTKSEEDFAEKIVKAIAESGVNVVVAGSTISEIMLHFFEKYKIMVVKIQSKFEMKRLCRVLGATAIARLGAPVQDEIGSCDEVYCREIGSQKVTIFRRDTENSKVVTIVLRGATTNQMDDVERAIDDATNVYRCAVKDGRYVYGGGATEMQLSQILEEEASKIKTLDQYAFRQYAQSFELIPRILVENAGQNANEVMTRLQKLNMTKPHALDVFNNGVIKPSEELQVFDHLKTKWWAIKFATDAAITILRVDQIIIAKPAGGPKKPDAGHWDED